MPKPSAPNFLDKNMRYINPRNLSAKENAVTYATVLNIFLILFTSPYAEA